MQGIKRKIVFITAYEVIGWVISSLALAFLSGNSSLPYWTLDLTSYAVPTDR